MKDKNLSAENSEVIGIRVTKEFRAQLLKKLTEDDLKVGFATRLFWREYLEGKIAVPSPSLIIGQDSTLSKPDNT